jgi:hypothetical protein
MINFKTNNPVLYRGLLSVLFYFGVIAVISLIIDPVLIMFTFYFPGFIFGIFISRRLNENINKQALIVILSTIEFLCALLFTSKDWNYIELRRLIFGGLFAVIFLGTIDLICKIRVKYFDYLLILVVGFSTTCFIWTNNFTSFNPWLIVLSIGLWQLGFSWILNKSIKSA